MFILAPRYRWSFLTTRKTWWQELDAVGHMIASFTVIYSVSLADDSKCQSATSIVHNRGPVFANSDLCLHGCSEPTVQSSQGPKPEVLPPLLDWIFLAQPSQPRRLPIAMPANPCQPLTEMLGQQNYPAYLFPRFQVYDQKLS